jgi:ubiquinone/menaquinone biosynthesis C-methylase UbiE
MPDHSHSHSDPTLLPGLLELDAVVHASVLERMIAVALELTPNARTIVDLGSGTGTGTFGLTAAFAAARVVAVDVDEEMLQFVRRGATERRIAGRVETMHADVATTVPDLSGVDLVWSSNAMHEVSEPSAAFRNVFRMLRPGGALLVAEMDTPPTVLPQAYAALECALRSAAAATGPGPDWSAAIAAAGFESITTQTVESDQVLRADGTGGAYAALELRRLAQHALPHLSSDDIAVLRRVTADLNGAHELLDEVRIRGTRTIWTARRP